MATYNGEEYIASQIESIQKQSFSNWKLIIRDDGSSDNTLNIVNDFAKEDKRITVINDSLGNNGVVGNFEILLENSNAEYIMFSDQDDVWLPEKVFSTFELMLKAEKENKEKPILIFTDAIVVSSNLQQIHTSYIEEEKINVCNISDTKKLAIRNSIMGCTVMINSKAKSLIIPFNKYVIMHDWWIGLIISHFGKIFYLPKQTILYRQHGNNQVGCQKINLQYYLNRLLHIAEIVKINYKYYKMLKSLPFRINITRCLFLKIKQSMHNFNIELNRS